MWHCQPAFEGSEQGESHNAESVSPALLPEAMEMEQRENLSSWEAPWAEPGMQIWGMHRWRCWEFFHHDFGELEFAGKEGNLLPLSLGEPPLASNSSGRIFWCGFGQDSSARVNFQCLSPSGFVVQVAEPGPPVRGAVPVPVPDLQTQEDAICGALQPQRGHRQPAPVSDGDCLSPGHLESWDCRPVGLGTAPGPPEIL